MEEISIQTKSKIKRAIMTENIELFRSLISDFPDLLKLSDDCGRSLLHIATAHGKTKMTRYLTEEVKMDPNIKCNNNNTPMHFAVLNKKMNVIDILLENGGSPCEINDNGNTPIVFACESANLEIFHKLFEACTQQEIQNLAPTISEKTAKGIANGNEDCWKIMEFIVKNNLMTDYRDVSKILKKHSWISKRQLDIMIEDVVSQR